MKLSIVIPVLNSHEVLRRQLLHFAQMGLPSDTELIIVDDGSDPPLRETAFPPGSTSTCSTRINGMYSQSGYVGGKTGVQILETGDFRPWTWALARNAGARIARGEYLLMYDLDHVAPRYLIDFVREFDGPRVQFIRQFGVLDEHGILTQDRDVLEAHGVSKMKSLGVGPHPNMFAMRRDVFWEIGGYREDLVERSYPQGEDRLFKKAWHNYARATGALNNVLRPVLYVFPSGKLIGDVDADPQKLFHGLSRKTKRNHWYKQQLEREKNAQG